MGQITIQLGYEELCKMLNDKVGKDETGEGWKENEFGIEVKNSIVQSFADKYIKSLANSAVFEEYKKKIESEVKIQIGTQDLWSKTVTLTTPIKNQITAKINNEFNELFEKQTNILRSKVNLKFEELYKTFEANIDKRIDNLIEDNLEKIVNDRVQQRLKAIFENVKDEIAETNAPLRKMRIK